MKITLKEIIKELDKIFLNLVMFERANIYKDSTLIEVCKGIERENLNMFKLIKKLKNLDKLSIKQVIIPCSHQVTIETYILNQKYTICLHCDKVINKEIKNIV